MKKILSIAVLLAGITFSAMAQEKKTEVRQDIKKERKMKVNADKHKSVEEIAQMKTDRMNKTLKFTDVQKQEVYALELNKAKKAAAKREEMRKSRDAYRQEMRADQAAFQKLLSPEQQTLYKDKLVEGRKRHSGSHHRNFKRSDMQNKRFDRKAPVEKEVKESVENSSNG